MKAAQINEYGGPEKIIITENAVEPILKEGQILVEVYAAGLNPIEDIIMKGFVKDALPLTLPINVGGDFSGVVAKLGDGVKNFKVGDEVYGDANHFRNGSGAVAEFVAADALSSASKPKSLNHIESSSLPLVGVSAIQALEEHISLKKGDKILIHGGAGGIGSLAIQLAKHLGAYVATTVSTESVDFAKSLGAELVIDYKNENFEEKVSGYDAVFDTTRADYGEASLKVLKKGGVIVFMANQFDKDKAKGLGIKAINQATSVTTEKLDRLASLVDEGVIKSQIDKIFPMEETRQAFEYFENGHPKGKVIVSVKPD